MKGVYILSTERKVFLASDDTEISYIEIGEGRPFLWIHGWGGNAERQIPILEGLCKHHFRCICFDQRGCGETPATDSMGVPQSARDAKELLEHLKIDNAIMLGYSMGAAVLLSYIEQFGTLHLSRIIIGEMTPKPLNDDGWRFGLYQGWYTKEQLDRDLYNMEHNYQEFALCFAEQTIFLHTPDEPRSFDVDDKYKECVYQKAEKTGKRELLDYFMMVPAGNQRANRIYWETCDNHDYRLAVDKINVPVGLFYANPGSIYDPHAAYWMATHIKDVTLYCFDSCTHLANLEKPEEFIRRIIEFAGKGNH